MKTPTLLAPLLTGPYAEKFPQPTYVLVQNGLNVERDLYDAIEKLQKGPPSIISAALWIATNLQEGNLAVHNDFVCIITFFYTLRYLSHLFIEQTAYWDLQTQRLHHNRKYSRRNGDSV
jgi:hypothetical protein